jgi:hypothetical protein
MAKSSTGWNTSPTINIKSDRRAYPRRPAWVPRPSFARAGSHEPQLSTVILSESRSDESKDLHFGTSIIAMNLRTPHEGGIAITPATIPPLLNRFHLPIHSISPPPDKIIQ